MGDIYFSFDENKKIIDLSHKWKISKNNAIKKIVREYLKSLKRGENVK